MPFALYVKLKIPIEFKIFGMSICMYCGQGYDSILIVSAANIVPRVVGFQMTNRAARLMMRRN